MLPTKRRVKKTSFEKIMKDGVFLPAVNFYMRYLDPTPLKLRGTSLPPSKFAFVVPVKVVKTSVSRHLIKRKISAVVENSLIRFKAGVDSIIFIKRDISTFSYDKIEKEVLDLFKKASLLNEK